jgi:muramoyltetrapeptide carboxypeptidase
MERLRGMGYEPVLMPHALDRGPLYYAGTVEQRVSDLHAAFADAGIDGIVCTRGGWGSAELLPFLDAGLIKNANPKAFVGYSDHTSLHVWMRRFAGMVTFHGPMVAADFARGDGWMRRVGMRRVERGPMGGRLGCGWAARACGRDGGGRVRWGMPVDLCGGAGYAVCAGGMRRGFCFSRTLGRSRISGTGMLLHLRYAGQLERVTGIVFGDMTQCVAAEERSCWSGDSALAARV